jgi:hypothetical protein
VEENWHGIWMFADQNGSVRESTFESIMEKTFSPNINTQVEFKTGRHRSLPLQTIVETEV